METKIMLPLVVPLLYLAIAWFLYIPPNIYHKGERTTKEREEPNISVIIGVIINRGIILKINKLFFGIL